MSSTPNSFFHWQNKETHIFPIDARLDQSVIDTSQTKSIIYLHPTSITVTARWKTHITNEIDNSDIWSSQPTTCN